MSPNLTKVIQKLKRFYGEPLPPKTTDPFELILLEGIAYLVDDDRREKALEHLRKTGTAPGAYFERIACPN